MHASQYFLHHGSSELGFWDSPSITVNAVGCVCACRVTKCLLCANRLIGVVSLAVGEEIVNDHADDGEEEDNEGPDDLAGHRTV